MKVKMERAKAGLKQSIQKTKTMASSPVTLWQIDGETNGKWQTLFWGAPKSLQIMKLQSWLVTAAMKLKDICSLEEKLWQT